MPPPRNSSRILPNRPMGSKTKTKQETIVDVKKLLDPKYLREIAIQSSQTNEFALRMQAVEWNTSRTKKKKPWPDKSVEKPRPGIIGDVAKALIAVPAIAAGLERMKREALYKIDRQWGKLPLAGKAAIITTTVTIGGGLTAAIYSRTQSRKNIFDLVRGKNIDLPFPGVNGLSIELKSAKENRAIFKLDLSKLLNSLM